MIWLVRRRKKTKEQSARILENFFANFGNQRSEHFIYKNVRTFFPPQRDPLTTDIIFFCMSQLKSYPLTTDIIFFVCLS